MKDNIGEVSSIIWNQNGQNVKGVRYSESVLLTLKELQDFTGKYEIPELNVYYKVSVKDNALTIQLPKTFRAVNIDTELKLKRIEGDKFFGSLSTFEFRRNKNGKINGFVISDVGRLRNIEFTKIGLLMN